MFPGGRYFTVVCAFSHRNNDDPIMHSRHPGLSHNHTYAGNRSVDAFSTSASLRSGSTTCDFPQDASGYWAPTLYMGREPIQPMAVLVYYVKRTTADVVPFPADLEIVAGDATARKAQRKSVVSWGCGGFGGSKRYALIPACGRSTFVSSSPTAGTERRATAPTIRATWPIRREGSARPHTLSQCRQCS